MAGHSSEYSMDYWDRVVYYCLKKRCHAYRRLPVIAFYKTSLSNNNSGKETKLIRVTSSRYHIGDKKLVDFGK
jgi:hypothetical protein